MPLSDQERARIRHHLGYLNVSDAYTFVLGSPAAVETTYIIEGAMNRILEVALPQVRQIVRYLDTIEEQMIGDLELMAVDAIGEIQVNQEEQKQLTRAYDRWVASLANEFGCIRNPFDKRLGLGGSAGCNVSVRT